MKAFETTFENVLYRFVLMMGVVLVSFIAGVPLLAILALPIALTAFLGLKFEMPKEKKKQATMKSLGNRNIAA